VIADFLAAWPLFRDAWITGWLLAVLLGMLGVLVVARDQIFIGAAVSQASVLGLAVAFRLGDALGADGAWMRTDAVVSGMAVAASALAAVFTTRGGGAGASHEARTGWVYLLAGSVAILVVAHSPHGLEEVHRILSSSIVGATRTDVVVTGALALIAALVVWRTHRVLLLLAIDPAMAAAVGVRVGRWNVGLSLALGIAVGVGIRSAGVLFTFGCLVLPALVARNVCREMRPLFAVAGAVALAASGAGFVLAHHGDYPPAQMTVALLCLLLALTASLRTRRRALLALVVTAVGCAPASIPPPAHPPARLAVATPENRTGDELVVSGRWDVAMLLGRPVVTVPDVLARDLAATLASRGFTVVAADAGGAARLVVVLRRWVPDLPRGEFVDVDLTATLHTPDGAVLWTARRDRWLVPTRGAPTVADALGMAARDVATALVGAWRAPAVSSPDAR
jgi:zinc/manganese transport system permease protein